MKKHITPYLLILLLILVLAGGAFYLTRKSGTMSPVGGASVFNGTPIIAPGYYFIDLNGGNGKCWRGIYEDDGTPVAVYSGTWAAGTGECRLAIQAPHNNNINIAYSGGTTSVTVRTGEEYFTDSVGMQFLQLKLMQSGVLDASKVTGTYTPDTFLALKAFQKKNGLPETGYPNAATVEALNKVTFTTSEPKKNSSPTTRSIR